MLVPRGAPCYNRHIIIKQEAQIMSQNSEWLSLIESRRSIRRFKPDPIPAEILDQILTAGT